MRMSGTHKNKHGGKSSGTKLHGEMYGMKKTKLIGAMHKTQKKSGKGGKSRSYGNPHY